MPFTDVKSTMANNNMALSKRPRNIPTHNETVCASIAAARAPQSPSLHIRRQNMPAHNHNCELNTRGFRRLMFCNIQSCDIQRCLRVLSGARHQQSSEGMGSSPAATQKPKLHWQPHKCLYSSRHIVNTPHKRSSLRLTSTSPEPPKARLSRTPSVAHSTETQPAREPIHSTSRQSPIALATP
eukprot:scaffold16995_cov127-Isochrysis_galbana.AAC.3